MCVIRIIIPFLIFLSIAFRQPICTKRLTSVFYCDIISFVGKKTFKEKFMKTRDLTIIPLFTALIIVGAYLKIPTPICPITLQILFTTLAGVLLGGKKGAAAVILYIMLGLIGLPVFTGGGGIGYVLSPTFGYMIGFVLGAYITGTIAHSGEPTMKRLVPACLTGLFIVFALGVVYCYLINRVWLGNSVSVRAVLVAGLLLPLPGDIVLCFFTAALGCRLIPIMKRMTANSH